MFPHLQLRRGQHGSAAAWGAAQAAEPCSPSPSVTHHLHPWGLLCCLQDQERVQPV